MQHAQSRTERISVSTEIDKHPRSRHRSTASSRMKISASAAFRRGPAAAASKQQQLHQQQQQQQVTTTLLQRRDRLRVYEEDEDVTPRNLVHPIYGTVEDRRTAFDAIGLAKLGSSRTGSISQQARASLATVSSFSSIYTIDEILAARQSESVLSSARVSLRGSLRTLDGGEDDEETPSQFHLPRFDSKEFFSPSDKITIKLKETETFFLFEMPQLTEDARTSEGQAVIEENEWYKRIMSGAGRKIVDAESQTPQLYTKTRGTYIGREERKNRATFVNNWIMYDTYENEQQFASGDTHDESRFKFPVTKVHELNRDTESQLAAIAVKDEYEDATRVTLRILASKDYEKAQKRFAGLLLQDPCDPDLELVYGLELLWRHVSSIVQRRPASSLRWNPVNQSLLAVGYGAVTKSHSNEETPEGIVLIWCAKNPTEPDRCYEFNSSVSDLDWSRSRPNLLAIGFYDGVVRIIDVSKKNLTVIRQSQRKTSPSYSPHWQIQWWPIATEPFNHHCQGEQLYTCNQDGRVCYYPIDEDFASHEILQLQRIEGKIPGVRRVNHCLGHDIPISRSPGALLLRRHPEHLGVYLVGTEEGCVHRCSVSHPHSHLESFLAHDGPIYGLEYSPFCASLILSCGADWTTRIWAEGLNEPLLVFTTRMACVAAAAWSPRNSTVFATAVANEICIWDIRRKTHRPASITQVSPNNSRLLRLEFTRSGEQLVATDEHGYVYVYCLTGMPLPAFDQKRALVEAVQKSLITKPKLLQRLKKLGVPFDA